MVDPFEDLFAEDMPAPDVSGLVSAETLGTLLGISGRSVRDLASRGIVAKGAIGRYAMHESVRSYCAHLREQAAARSGSSTLTEERVRVAREQGDKLAMQNAIARGEMVASRTVRTEWASILRDVRAGLLAVPSRCGAALLHLTVHDVSEIDREIRSALESLANGH